MKKKIAHIKSFVPEQKKLLNFCDKTSKKKIKKEKCKHKVLQKIYIYETI
jgi:hypothetical protein